MAPGSAISTSGSSSASSTQAQCSPATASVHRPLGNRGGAHRRQCRRRARRASLRARDLTRARDRTAASARREHLRRFRARAAHGVIVRWGSTNSHHCSATLGLERPLLDYRLAFRRLAAACRKALGRACGRSRQSRPRWARNLLVTPLGGGSAIDTAKVVVSVPTTYSGAEWTTFFGTRDEVRGGRSGATLAGIVYDARLTLEAWPAGPRTAMNALARTPPRRSTPRRAIPPAVGWALRRRRGAPAVLAARATSRPAPACCAAPCTGAALGVRSWASPTRSRRRSAAGATAAPHGAMNALVLAPTLRFDDRSAAALERLGEALGGDAATEAERLARLGGFRRLRDFDVPQERALHGPRRRWFGRLRAQTRREAAAATSSTFSRAFSERSLAARGERVHHVSRYGP